MRYIVEKSFANGKLYIEASGNSTETKPTAGICDGSIFLESNTGKVFFFNENTSNWVEQFSFQS